MNANVLMVTRFFPPEFGGAAIQAAYLAHQLRNEGVQIEFYVDNGSRKSTVDSYDGFKIYKDCTYSNDGFLRNIIYFFRLFLFVFKNPKYKILHFHSINGIESLLFPFFKCMKKKIIFKLTLVGIDDPASLKKRKIGVFIWWGLRFVDVFVAISQELYDISTAAGIPRDKIVNISNGVNVDKFKPVDYTEKDIIKEKLGLSKTSKIFLSVGKIEPRKGYDFLLSAWKKIQTAFPGSILLIAGPGNSSSNKYYIELKKILSNCEFSNVSFLGQIDNVDEYMKISDGFFFCSIQEGFGNVLIEAISTAVPVVTRHIQGITGDIVNDLDIGRVVHGDSFEKYADTAISFIKNVDRQKVLKASDKIRLIYDIRIVSRKYVKLYESLVS